MNAGLRDMVLVQLKDKTIEGLWERILSMKECGWRIMGTVFERNGGYRAVMARDKQKGGRRCSSHTATSSL